jgi:hypothetical protein
MQQQEAALKVAQLPLKSIVPNSAHVTVAYLKQQVW